MIGSDSAIMQKIFRRFEIGLFACVWRPLCMRVAATSAQLECNKNLNKTLKTQLKNLKFFTTLVLAKAYSERPSAGCFKLVRRYL